MPALTALLLFAATQSTLACSVVPDKTSAERGPALPVYGAEVRPRPGQTCALLDRSNDSATWQPLGPAKTVVQGARLGKAWISRTKGGPKLVYRTPPHSNGHDEVRLNNILPATVVFKISILP